MNFRVFSLLKLLKLVFGTDLWFELNGNWHSELLLVMKFTNRADANAPFEHLVVCVTNRDNATHLIRKQPLGFVQ